MEIIQPLAQARALVGTVLVVDDDPAALSLAAALLKENFRVRAARSGDEALRAAALAPVPDLVLLDVMMPGIDGFDVLSRLKADPATRNIPVILVTALDADADEEKGLRLGAADYITKPIRPVVFRARVDAQIALKQARDRLQDQNALLVREVALRSLQNDIVEEASINALATLAEARDHETGAHLYRTRAYMEILARSLSRHPRYTGLDDPGRRELLSRAAMLHDVGKVCIPDHILLKPGPLTPDEFAVMKTHAQLGADAIADAMRKVEASIGRSVPAPRFHASLAFLELACQIAGSHHERWDGRGYPSGLAGEAIPLPARLMALVDYFDALSTQRVYRAAMPIDEVFESIRAGSGTLFDPEIVEAMLEARPEFEATARQYPDPERT